MRCRIARLRRKLAGMIDQRLVVAGQHPAAGGRDDFVAVEGIHRRPRVPTGVETEVRGRRTEGGSRRAEVRGRRAEVRGRRAEVRGPRSEIPRADGLGRVADDRDSIRITHLPNARQIAALTVQIGGNHRRRPLARLRAALQLLGQQLRIQIPGLPVAVHKAKFAILECGRGHTADERQRRGIHNGTRARVPDLRLLPSDLRPPTSDLRPPISQQVPQGQMDRRRPTGKRHRMLETAVLDKLALERIHHRPARRDEVAVECLSNKLLLQYANMRGRKIDFSHAQFLVLMQSTSFFLFYEKRKKQRKPG